MKILAIESSCDETATAIVEKTADGWVRVLGEAVASSNEMHVTTGGIVPEVAAREQLKSMMPMVMMAVSEAAQISNDEFLISKQAPSTNEQITKWVRENVDAIAVTAGPGLIGSLLVGVETAKALAWAWDKPLVPVNHLLGHVYANWIRPSIPGSAGYRRSRDLRIPEFPLVALIVSGGHTELVLMKSHEEMEVLGGTRDDAAGECLDKCARIMGLAYPGGPAISAAAEKFQISNFKFQTNSKDQIQYDKQISLPRPLLHEDTYDFSFSGLKIAVMRELQKGERLKVTGESELVAMLAYELQEAVVEVLVGKLMKAVEEFQPKSVLIAGGVAANSRLRESLKSQISNSKYQTKLFIPDLKYCTDNAVMIGAAACYQFKPVDAVEIVADPGMGLAD